MGTKQLYDLSVHLTLQTPKDLTIQSKEVEQFFQVMRENFIEWKEDVQLKNQMANDKEIDALSSKLGRWSGSL